MKFENDARHLNAKTLQYEKDITSIFRCALFSNSSGAINSIIKYYLQPIKCGLYY